LKMDEVVDYILKTIKYNGAVLWVM
jgi:hypothetical protein